MVHRVEVTWPRSHGLYSVGLGPHTRGPAPELHFLTILLYIQTNTHELGDAETKRTSIEVQMMCWLSHT